MSDVELVIKIHEKDYQAMKDGHIPFSVLDVIMHGKPLKTGHWTNDNYKPVLGACCYECTCCGYGTDEKYKFCPNCGAKMESEE